MTLCVGLTLCLAALVGTVTAESFSQCVGRANGDYIPGRKGCRSFIFCSGDYSHEDSCPMGLYFNPDSGMCDDPSNVPCQDDEPSDVDVNINHKEVEILPLPETPAELTPRPPQPTPPGPPLWTSEPASSLQPSWSQPPNQTSTGSTPSWPTSPRPEESKPTPPGPPLWTSEPASSLQPSWSQPPNQTSTGSTPSWPTSPRPEESRPPTWTPPPVSTAATWPTSNFPNTSSVPLTTAPPPANATTGWPSSTTLNTTVAWPTTNTTPSSSLAFLFEHVKARCSELMGGYFAYPNECRFFYRCTNGQLTKQECAPGYGWDAKLKMCTTSGCSPRDAPIMNKN